MAYTSNPHYSQVRDSTIDQFPTNADTLSNGCAIDVVNSFSISVDSLIKAASVKRRTNIFEKVATSRPGTKPNSGRVKNSSTATTITSPPFFTVSERTSFARERKGLQVTNKTQKRESLEVLRKLEQTSPAMDTSEIPRTSTTTVSNKSNTRSNPNQHQSRPTSSQPTLLTYYPSRILTLFLLGSLASFIIDHLLTQNKITEYPHDIMKLINTAAWIPPTCGCSAVLVGSLFPLADYWCLRKPQQYQREWSNVMRCTGGFIGVAYAATKLPWKSSSQVSLTLALISVVLWFLFDRTLHGFIMSLLFSSIGTAVMYILVSNGIYSFTQADFFGVRSWIPCILYSSCVCFGMVGRQLMIVPEEWFEEREQKRSKRASDANMNVKKNN